MSESLRVVPLTLPTANDCVRVWHRHHAEIPAGFVWYCLGAINEGRVAGAAICGRPTNRNNDDRMTVELLRLASDGHQNVCSFLLGASARVARQMGAKQIITYTLDSESGSSLRAAGWNRDKDGIQSCWTRGTSRRHAVQRDHMDVGKTRWSVWFRDAEPYELPDDLVVADDQIALELAL